MGLASYQVTIEGQQGEKADEPHCRTKMGREGVLSIMYYTEQHMTKRVFAPQEPGHISKSDKIECNTFIAGPLYKPHDKKPCRTGESVGDMYKSV